MRRFEEIEPLRKSLADLRRSGRKIGFIPTMGALHEGHLSLIRLARQHCDEAVVSIFVNPLQFNDKNDFVKYPVTIEQDCRMLSDLKVHSVFMPAPEIIYPSGHQTRVAPGALSLPMEGGSRPGHFEGVTTVVHILFSIVEPDFAVFGEKDFQQLRIIEQMVADLRSRVVIIRAPLIRESDGLAMSSRNARLSPEARKKAPLIHTGLVEGVELYIKGCRNADMIEERVVSCIASDPSIKIEYVQVAREDTLEEVSHVDDIPVRIFAAARLDGVRLIDNMSLPAQEV